MSRKLGLLAVLLVVFVFAADVFALTRAEETLKIVERDATRLKNLVANLDEYLDRPEETESQLQLLDSIIEEAKYYMEIGDEFEAELKLALAKIVIGRAYAAASRSPLAETRIISIDASTLSFRAKQGTLPQLVQQIKDTGFNTVFVEVLRDDGYVVYPSKYMILAPDLEGLDPLGELVRLCNENGIDVFPWQKVFFAAADGTPGPILTEHPEWAAVDRFGKPFEASGLAWFSPAHPEARELIFNYILEMWEMYDFAGCQLDYVRNATNPLENNDFSYDKATLDLFMTYYGYNPLDLPYPSAYDRTREGYVPGDSGAKWENWQAFREELITSMVARLAIAMKEKKPDAFISCGFAVGNWGGGTIQQAYLRAQNWPEWVQRHLVDALSPLVYQNEAVPVEREVTNVRALAAGRAIQYPSLGVISMDEPYQLLEQIEIVRSIGEPGMRVFAYPHMKEEHFRLLKEGPFRNAAFPVHRDLYRASYLAFQDLMSQVSEEKSFYLELERMYNRIEASVEGAPAQKIAAARYLITRIERFPTGEYALDIQLQRIKSMLSLYVYRTKS